MEQTLKYRMKKRQQTVLYTIIILVGLFLHLLLWDVDFLSRISRSIGNWSAFVSMTGVLYDWFRLYLVRGIGIWMIMMAVFLLFVVLPLLTRYQYLPIKSSPLLAIAVSVYFFLLMKLFNLY